MSTQGASLTNAASLVPASGFLFDMNRFFQALLSRFLKENLADYDVQAEKVLREIFAYDPVNNPRYRSPPKLWPDFLIQRNHRVVAVLDAKYRDLWERNLPREMLYQLSLYAMGQENAQRRAVILYPTLEKAARPQVIFVKDSLHGTAKAEVILRPMNLLELDELLKAKHVHARRNRAEFAHRLVFGTSQHISFN